MPTEVNFPRRRAERDGDGGFVGGGWCGCVVGACKVDHQAFWLKDEVTTRAKRKKRNFPELLASGQAPANKRGLDSMLGAQLGGANK